jgi:hypothetical protein
MRAKSSLLSFPFVKPLTVRPERTGGRKGCRTSADGSAVHRDDGLSAGRDEGVQPAAAWQRIFTSPGDSKAVSIECCQSSSCKV